MSRVSFYTRPYDRLEPYDGKLSRTVLRGGTGSNASLLPDMTMVAIHNEMAHLALSAVTVFFIPVAPIPQLKLPCIQLLQDQSGGLMVYMNIRLMIALIAVHSIIGIDNNTFT